MSTEIEKVEGDWDAVRRVIQESEQLTRAVLAEVFGHHEALGCCDPKTLEHVWQTIAPGDGEVVA